MNVLFSPLMLPGYKAPPNYSCYPPPPLPPGLLSTHAGSAVAAAPAGDETSRHVPGQSAGGLWSPRAPQDKRSQHPQHRRLVHTLLSAGMHRGWSETSCLFSDHPQRHWHWHRCTIPPLIYLKIVCIIYKMNQSGSYLVPGGRWWWKLKEMQELFCPLHHLRLQYLCCWELIGNGIIIQL